MVTKPVKKRKGRPFITVRLDPGSLKALIDRANRYNVYVAEVARAIIQLEIDQPREGEVKEYLRLQGHQIPLPLAVEPKSPRGRGKRGGPDARAS